MAKPILMKFDMEILFFLREDRLFLIVITDIQAGGAAVTKILLKSIVNLAVTEC